MSHWIYKGIKRSGRATKGRWSNLEIAGSGHFLLGCWNKGNPRARPVPLEPEPCRPVWWELDPWEAVTPARYTTWNRESGRYAWLFPPSPSLSSTSALHWPDLVRSHRAREKYKLRVDTRGNQSLMAGYRALRTWYTPPQLLISSLNSCPKSCNSLPMLQPHGLPQHSLDSPGPYICCSFCLNFVHWVSTWLPSFHHFLSEGFDCSA